jgi:outer membrane protein assembly factor BamB
MTVIGLLTAGGCRSHDKTPVEKPLPVSASSFMRQWALDLKLGKNQITNLYLSEDTVFAYSRDFLIYGVGRSGGELKYMAEPNVSGGVLRAPLVLGEHIVVPSGSTIDILNSRGRVQRTIELEKPTRSGATGTGSIIYIGLDHTGGTGVMAQIDVSKPYKVVNWELMSFGAMTPTPVLFERVIYAGSEDGRLYAVTDERRQIWALEKGAGTFNTQGKFVSDIKADTNGVYASNTDSKLYCLERLNGHLKWIYYASAPLKTAPVVMAQLVYQYVPGQGIVAIDKINGQFNRQPKWTVKSAVQVLSEDQQYVYLRRRDNILLAADKNTGEIAFTSKSHPFEVFATNTTDSMIYGSTRDGRIWAVRPVLRAGEVGTVVMDFHAEPLALAR